MFRWKLLNRVKEVKKGGEKNAHKAKITEGKVWRIKGKNFNNSTYQLNQHNEYNKYPDHAVNGWHPAAE